MRSSHKTMACMYSDYRHASVLKLLNILWWRVLTSGMWCHVFWSYKLLASCSFWPWRWSQYVPPKFQSTSTWLCHVISYTFNFGLHWSMKLKPRFTDFLWEMGEKKKDCSLRRFVMSNPHPSMIYDFHVKIFFCYCEYFIGGGGGVDTQQFVMCNILKWFFICTKQT
jgi:hypothetical protein